MNRLLLALALAVVAHHARAKALMDPIDDRGRAVISTPGYHDGPPSTLEEQLDQLRSLSTAHCLSGYVLERRAAGLVCVEERRQ